MGLDGRATPIPRPINLFCPGGSDVGARGIDGRLQENRAYGYNDATNRHARCGDADQPPIGDGQPDTDHYAGADTDRNPDPNANRQRHTDPYCDTDTDRHANAHCNARFGFW